MFDRVLVANRGEIACRIFRTAKQLGLTTVAVYATTDKNALHIKQADLAYPLSGDSLHDTYLNGAAIVAAAKATGAQAIHPGYGFLSENAEFAQLCGDNGIVFIGPSPSAINAMGSKMDAKALMQSSKVPVLPGYHGENQDAEFLAAQANDVGYPIMLKASAGGGGKGMRIVHSAGDFTSALDAVKRESLAAFGDDKVLLERYVEKPRHIEFQIFGDTKGNYLHLFERDCSIQRRHQKIIEESPAPGMSDELRSQMGAAAIAAAKSIDYVGAGTIEFIVDQQQRFYFMEMNTRLQVEHPVTEMVTGIDLVEWQFNVAAGAALPCKQEQLIQTGHAIEARLYAEDTNNQFLPSSGRLNLFQLPDNSEHLRIDSGVIEGGEITIDYDPMMAKIICHGANRDIAINQLIRALSSTHIIGVFNNATYLCRVVDSDAFRQADLSTAFLQENDLDECKDNGEESEKRYNFAAALAALFIQFQRTQQSQQVSPIGAWGENGWRLNLPRTNSISLKMAHNSNFYQSDIRYENETGTISCNESKYDFTIVKIDAVKIIVQINSQLISANAVYSAYGILLKYNYHEYHFIHPSSSDLIRTELDAYAPMISPMPGKVIAALVTVNDEVKKDQPVMIIEAMKMEHTIYADKTGRVVEINFQENDSVKANAELLVIEANINQRSDNQ